MKNRISLIAGAFFLITSIISCKKSNDAPPPPTEFQAITFKFGPDSTLVGSNRVRYTAGIILCGRRVWADAVPCRQRQPLVSAIMRNTDGSLSDLPM